MKNIIKPMLRYKTLFVTSSKNASTQQHNSDMFPYKLCQVKSIPYLSTKLPSTHRSLRDSLLIKSSVCKGVVFCPNAARNLNPLVTRLMNLSILLYDPNKEPGPWNHPGPGKSDGHEKILEEQQKELERLKKDPGKFRGDDEKFPKYKPQ